MSAVYGVVALDAGNIIALVGVILAIPGVGFGLYQLSRNQRTVRGQFLLDLHQLFAPYEEIHRAIEDPNWRPDAAELSQMRSYLGSFERLWILTEYEVVDLEVVERLYGYRIHKIRQNKHVRQYLEENSDGWEDFFRCSEALDAAYRRRLAPDPAPMPPPLER